MALGGLVRNLKVMARMGVYFEEEVQKRYPEFPTRKGEWGWEDYLPPMSPGLHSLAGLYSENQRRDNVICRMWHGWTATTNADAYDTYLKSELFPRLERELSQRGYCGFRSVSE